MIYAKKHIGENSSTAKKKAFKKNQVTNYDVRIDQIVEAINKDTKIHGIKVTKEEVKTIADGEYDFGGVLKHPVRAFKIAFSRLSKMPQEVRNKIRIKVIAGLVALTLAVGVMTTSIGVAAKDAKDKDDKIDGQDITISQQDETIHEQGISGIIKDYQAAVNTSKTNIENGYHSIVNLKNKADRLLDNQMGKTLTGYVALSEDEGIVDFYNQIVNSFNESSAIINFDGKNLDPNCPYAIAINGFNLAQNEKDIAKAQSYQNEIQRYDAIIGHPAVKEVVTPNGQHFSVKTSATATADSTNVATDYYTQADQAFDELNEYVQSEYSEIIDLATTPELSISFNAEDLKQYNDKLVDQGIGKAQDVLSCVYERESGNVKMLVKCKTNVGEYFVEKQFNMDPKLKVVDSAKVMEYFEQAYNKNEVKSNAYKTSLETSASETEIKMNIGNNQGAKGTPDINYDVNVKYFANKGEKGVSEITGKAVVVLTNQDGKVTGYKTYSYSSTVQGKVTKANVENKVIDSLLKKINQNIKSGSEITLDFENEL